MTEERLKRLETMIKEIHDFLYMGEETGRAPDQEEFRRAIRELGRGNRRPLQLYIQRGGKIPKTSSGGAT